jgi:hypothetical protein
MKEACLENKKPTSLEVDSVVVHEEVPKEEATVETVRVLKKRYRDWHLAVRRCGQPKKWTQGNGGSGKVLASCRGMASCTIPAPRGGHGHQGHGLI